MLFCLPALTPLYADEVAVLEGRDITVGYDGSLRNAARDMIERYPHIKDELEKILGWKIDFKPSILLIREHEKFQEMTGNPYVIAFAVPSRQFIVIDYSKMNINPFTLEVTLKHEVCHLLLGKNIPDERLPRWLNEGFCQWATGGVAELMVDGAQPSLSKASLAHRLIPLTLLDRRFPADKNQLILAYEQSKSVVDYMMTEHGQSSVVTLLNRLREGDAIDEAMRKGFSLSPDQLEKLWIDHVQGQVTWIGYLAANVYTILLFVAALLTVCGFLRVMVRRRLRASRREEDDDEEAGVS